MKTKVIFRNYPSGDLGAVAFFPELIGNNDPKTCRCYDEHDLFQDAITSAARLFPKATTKQAERLKAELEGLGYDLEIVEKFTASHRRVRSKQVKRHCKN